MNSKIITIIALTIFVIAVVQKTQAQPDATPSTTTPRSAITTTTSRPTIAPTCRPTPRCTRQSPRVCARNRRGMCRRFTNICHLHGVNCPKGRPVQAWSSVPLGQCENLPPNTTGNCVVTCPRRQCPKGGRKICVHNKNRQKCRLLANACVLKNLNCRATPRGNWSQTKMDRCKNMCVGGKPQQCRGSQAG